MAGISSLGVGSGVLNSDLVDQLVAAERKPVETRLTQETKRTEALISAYGKIRSAVTDVRLPMRQLGSPDALQSFSASSSGDNVQVSVDSAKASRGNYNLDVTQLASGQSLASGSFVDRDSTTLGQGTLNISVGDKTTNVTIDSSNNTLQGIANAINDADAGVSAGVIDTGDGYRLVMSSDDTGTANAAKISVTDTGDGNNTDASGLSRFAFNDTTQNLEETVTAKDAKMSVNGIEVTRSTNTVEGVVDGLSFTLNDTGQSQVEVSQDTQAVADKVQAFVDKFNTLKSTISELTSFSPEAGGSLLTGDSTVRNIENQLSRQLTSVVPGLEDANVRSLADVGITTNFQTGQLDFDAQKFQEQLKANPDDVTALFAEQGRTTDSQVEFVRSGTDTQPGEYDINLTQTAEQGGFLASSTTPASVTVDADNDELTFQVDGDTTASIQLTAGSYTRDELASEIQSQLNGSSALSSADKAVSVSVDGSGALQFNSTAFGSDSNVSITSVDTNTAADLGLSTQSGTAGQDVAGTINGRTAQGDGQVLFLDGDAGEAGGLQVRITGGSTGSRGSIQFIEGVSERTVDTISNIVGLDGALRTKTDSLNRELENISDEQQQLNDRIQSYRERLVSQFSAADARISQFNSTQQFLTQQLATLGGGNSGGGGGN
ncbi:flagellar cap protein FliD [Tamilnaduibacter salinus]|uniref:Flagellar hook-associated protein 2 n=1 Tax=Tamilnaduibacter salinus TaxID=1484056 RepID=A0A2A2I6V6_9GAMM|nr:flagellar filament capping protein FliD [Tamilnaduibacter salinus]PAV27387.1 flagellar cap protein FliD [Tamilnaduibacter salinus]